MKNNMYENIKMICPNCNTEWAVRFDKKSGYFHILVECRTCGEAFVKDVNSSNVVLVSKVVVEDLIMNERWDEFSVYIESMVNKMKGNTITASEINKLKILLSKKQDVNDFIKELK